MGDELLDQYIHEKFNEWKDDPKHPSRHANWIVTNNCKTEADNLINEAKKRRQKVASKIWFIALASLLIANFLLFGCDSKLKKAIAEYQGNGKIIYLKGPLLGTSGVAIKMPSFDISKSFEARYQLTGIPNQNRYIVYLVVPEPCPINQVLKGSFELDIYKNNILMNKIAVSDLKGMTNSVGGRENRFYFYGKGQFDVNKNGEDWSLKVKSTNESLFGPVNAFLLISAGGFK